MVQGLAGHHKRGFLASGHTAGKPSFGVYTPTEDNQPSRSTMPAPAGFHFFKTSYPTFPLNFKI